MKNKKNQITNFINSNTKKIVIGLLFLIVGFGLFVTINGTFSGPDHEEFVYIYSNNSDYEANEPGSWILYKDAFLIDENTLKIRYEVNSNALLDEKSKDVLFVVDNSDTLETNCTIASPKVAKTSLPGGLFRKTCMLANINNASKVLINFENNLDNRVAIVTYNENYSVATNFSDDYSVINETINSIDKGGYSNYVKALEGIDAVLENYDFSDDRELKIILYVNNVSTSNSYIEKQKYNELKAKYPGIKIVALHHIVDDNTVLDRIKNISDEQYLIDVSFFSPTFPGSLDKSASVSNSNSVENIFAQVIYSKEYKQFKIIDNINEEFFNFNVFRINEINNGEVGYNNNVLTWTLDKELLSGSHAILEIELGVNENALITNSLVPVSTSTQIKSIIEGIPDENVDTNLTPYVNFYHTVYIYTDEMPDECKGNITTNETQHKIGDTVNIDFGLKKCQNKTFKEFIDMNFAMCSSDSFYEYNKKQCDLLKDINYEIVDGKFKMPGIEVYLFPVFDEIEPYKEITEPLAILDSTSDFFDKIYESTSSPDDMDEIIFGITKIKKVDVLPNNHETFLVSTPFSDYSIYVWFDENTAFFYTEAEKIYLNRDTTYLFSQFQNLSDIEDLRYFDTTYVYNATGLFDGCNLTDLSPIANWDVSNIYNFDRMFINNTYLTDASAIDNWDVSCNGSYEYMFNNTPSHPNFVKLINQTWSNGTVICSNG